MHRSPSDHGDASGDKCLCGSYAFKTNSYASISFNNGYESIYNLPEKDALARKLAQFLNGYLVLNPPDTFDVMLKHFPPNSTVLTNGFYTLCTYIAALHVRAAVQKAPAVISGYWLGRAAYTIAKHFVDEPPPFDSKFWVWPKDLVKPDIVFFLTDQYSFHQFDDHKLVTRYLHVFHNWIEPNCVPVDKTQSVESMMEEIEPYLEEL